MPSFFKRIRRWWELRDPDVKYIVEVGVDKVPQLITPTVIPLENRVYVSATIDETSLIIDDPNVILSIITSSREEQRFSARLNTGLASILGRPQLSHGPSFVFLEGEDYVGRMIVYDNIITAARVDLPHNKTVYSLKAVDVIEHAGGIVNVSVVKLKEQMYEWGPHFSVFVKGIDSQHNYLVTVLNNLYIMMIAGSSKYYIDDALSSLIDYTKFHFRSEEKLFDKYGYPRAEQHRKEHSGFVEKVVEFNDKYRLGEAKLTLSILKFLADWVRNHILFSDHDYGVWFYEHNVPIIDDKRVPISEAERRKRGIAST